MFETPLNVGSILSIPKSQLDRLLTTLQAQEYQTVGPCIKDQAIVYANIKSLTELPLGYTSEQKAGEFRLVPSRRLNYFDALPGAQSWKQFLFPPRTTLFTAIKEGRWKISTEETPTPRYALIGVRACELAAIEIQDRVFLRSDYRDPIYRKRRDGLFILAVNCLHPASTCFCTSMQTGPRVRNGFDLCLTELEDVFLVEIGSELGRSALSQCTYQPANAFAQRTADERLNRSAQQMSRQLDTTDLPSLLIDHLDLKHWDEIAKRCLSCGNCTQVCPTCFCWDANDHVNLSATETRRERVWDSCFNPNYSYLAGGGNTRPNIRSRYRQWLTHKLGTWKEQFGTSGCVGCGRCITWCPVGIDLTEEIPALRKEARP